MIEHSDAARFGMYYYDRDMIGNEEERGLFLHVPSRHLRARPAWRLHAGRDRYDYILRFMHGATPFCWARIDSWWDDFTLCKLHGFESYSPLHPLPAHVIRDVRQDIERAGVDRMQRWIREFAKQLGDQTRANPLWHGTWRLAVADDYKGRVTRNLDEFMEVMRAPLYAVSRSVLPFPWPLRRVREESARVRMWRKLARRGELPPVLCMRVRALEADVICDGHDRLYAALCEGVEPNIIRLEPLREERLPEEAYMQMRERVQREHGYMHGMELSPRTVEHHNRRAIQAYGKGSLVPSMRVWPLEGGLWQWRGEIEHIVQGRVDDAHQGLVWDILAYPMPQNQDEES